MMTNEPHNIIWNAKNVSFFWENYAKNIQRHTGWMSEGSEKAINKRMKLILPGLFLSQKRTIVDWGCGSGSFAKLFAKEGHDVLGLDQSKVVSMIPMDIPGFLAISNSQEISEGNVDLVYALEVIEHVIDSELEFTISEWRRILKKDGFLLLSTPNEEDLATNSVVCPNCETEFHKVQHVRSFSIPSIALLMEKHGFELVNAWKGEFFFDTSRGHIIETIRKSIYLVRNLRNERINKKTPPHMMVLFNLKP